MHVITPWAQHLYVLGMPTGTRAGAHARVPVPVPCGHEGTYELRCTRTCSQVPRKLTPRQRFQGKQFTWGMTQQRRGSGAKARREQIKGSQGQADLGGRPSLLHQGGPWEPVWNPNQSDPAVGEGAGSLYTTATTPGGHRHWLKAAFRGCHLLHLQAAPVARGSLCMGMGMWAAGNQGGAGEGVTSPKPLGCLG